MTPDLRRRLAALPALAEPAASPAACKICGAPAALFDVVDLQKHCGFSNQYAFGLSGIEVPYSRCADCGFLFTIFFDDWTNRDWRQFIYNDDYVRVDPDYTGARPTRLAESIASVLRGCEHLRILDYGAGSGVFADHMRNMGFARIESYDPFSKPAPPQGHFDVVTCLEVIEHTTAPLAAIAAMQALLSPGGCLVFSQSVQPADIGEVRGAWWYIAPRNGHISMFTQETLTRLLPTPQHVLHGNGWLWAMAPSGLAQPLATSMPRIGPVISCLSLTAPDDGDAEHWHARELCGDSAFRWSKASTLEWLIPLPPHYPAQIQVQVPFRMQITDGFAAGCSMTIGGAAATLRVAGGALLANARLNGAPLTSKVVLQTPPPKSPFDLRGAQDTRPLGLAIPTPQRTPQGLQS